LIDSGNAADVLGIATRVHAVPTLMTDLPSCVALAREALGFAGPVQPLMRPRPGFQMAKSGDRDSVPRLPRR
jgi:hypothetical protein